MLKRDSFQHVGDILAPVNGILHAFINFFPFDHHFKRIVAGLKGFRHRRPVKTSATKP